MKIATGKFRVRPGDKVKLGKRPTLVEPYYKSKRHYKELLDGRAEAMRELLDPLPIEIDETCRVVLPLVELDELVEGDAALVVELERLLVRFDRAGLVLQHVSARLADTANLLQAMGQP